jgi:hypothetical protein
VSVPVIPSDTPPPTLGPTDTVGFGGFGEGAPLDLSGLSPAGEQAVLTRLLDRSFSAWAETAAMVGYCARPVRLTGTSDTYERDPKLDAIGRLMGSFDSADTPLGVLYRPCGNRRADVCPACSRVYARDTFEMIRAGLVGGKTIPERVAENPLLFVTLTAPSFGHVHAAHDDGSRCLPRSRAGRCGHGRLMSCMRRHDTNDQLIGAPLCDQCYDWASAVIWQYTAPELWRRTTITLRRGIAARLGVTETKLGTVASVQYAKVAEYQARGMVHFHALIRLDGPKDQGPGAPAPLDGHDLARLVKQAVTGTVFAADPVDEADLARVIGWGRQLDIKIVRNEKAAEDPGQNRSALTPEQVAGYLAKYSTKDANSLRDPTQPAPHLRRLAEVCRDLAARGREHAQWDDNPTDAPYALLDKWAHMLGFRGHFSTKSRQYSVTLGKLRRARHRYRVLVEQTKCTGTPLDLADLEARLLADDETETTRVIGSWDYQGTGWPRPGDTTLALAAAARAREYDQWKAHQRAANAA